MVIVIANEVPLSGLNEIWLKKTTVTICSPEINNPIINPSTTLKNDLLEGVTPISLSDNFSHFEKGIVIKKTTTDAVPVSKISPMGFEIPLKRIEQMIRIAAHKTQNSITFNSVYFQFFWYCPLYFTAGKLLIYVYLKISILTI